MSTACSEGVVEEMCFQEGLECRNGVSLPICGAGRSIVLALPQKRTDDRTTRDGTAVYSCVQ